MRAGVAAVVKALLCNKILKEIIKPFEFRRAFFMITLFSVMAELQVLMELQE